jgi:hypothetical protein
MSVATAERTRIQPNPGPQEHLLSCPCQEIFYGGARGGGKSYGVLLDYLKHVAEHGKGTKGIMFRRTLPELEDMQEKAIRILPGFGFRYNTQPHIWRHPCGAYLKMRFLDRDEHAQLYQGHEYNWMGFDDVGTWPNPAPIDKLRATLRAPGRKRMLLTGNPGGPGHNWLKRKYIDPAPPLVVVRDDAFWSHVFIPAKIADNPKLLEENPGYVNQLKASGPEWLVRAWLEGDWDVVAGGMFDDVWNTARHVIEPFKIPLTWTIRRAFDWGSSKPFSLGWWAEADGATPIQLPPEVITGHGLPVPLVLSGYRERLYPRGTMFRIGEWYGWNGTPNQGLKMTAAEIGRQLLARESSAGWAGRVRPGPADSAIFEVENGKSVAADFDSVGVRWEPAIKGPGSRVQGWERLRKLLKASLTWPMEGPGMFVFNTCRSGWIRTVPTLPRDLRKPDDVDSAAEDHAGDETRYYIMTPPLAMRTAPTRGF